MFLFFFFFLTLQHSHYCSSCFPCSLSGNPFTLAHSFTGKNLSSLSDVFVGLVSSISIDCGSFVFGLGPFYLACCTNCFVFLIWCVQCSVPLDWRSLGVRMCINLFLYNWKSYYTLAFVRFSDFRFW